MLPDGQPTQVMGKTHSFNKTEMKQQDDYKVIGKMKHPTPEVQGWSTLTNHSIQVSREEKENFLGNVVLAT